jgi:uracil-DNA glycosylase family 4
MAEDAPLTTENLQRQVRQHLESLRLAGIEWLPAGAGAELAGDPEPATAETGSVATPQAGALLGIESETEPVGPVSSIAAKADSPENLDRRRLSLEVLAQTVSACQRCPELVATRTQTVFGVGPTGVELCFIGEAPGADEDAQGEPFVGAAGQLLNKIIAACKLRREEVYICNIIKCRPPGNRTPTAQEAGNCREYLEKQLELVRPKFICTLGATAAQNLLGTTAAMGRLRRRFHDYRGTPVICTYHPA